MNLREFLTTLAEVLIIMGLLVVGGVIFCLSKSLMMDLAGIAMVVLAIVALIRN